LSTAALRQLRSQPRMRCSRVRCSTSRPLLMAPPPPSTSTGPRLHPLRSAVRSPAGRPTSPLARRTIPLAIGAGTSTRSPSTRPRCLLRGSPRTTQRVSRVDVSCGPAGLSTISPTPADVEFDVERKILADLAVNDAPAFSALVEVAKGAAGRCQSDEGVCLIDRPLAVGSVLAKRRALCSRRPVAGRRRSAS
jgi:hypothetical protein